MKFIFSVLVVLSVIYIQHAIAAPADDPSKTTDAKSAANVEVEAKKLSDPKLAPIGVNRPPVTDLNEDEEDYEETEPEESEDEDDDDYDSEDDLQDLSEPRNLPAPTKEVQKLALDNKDNKNAEKKVEAEPEAKKQ